MSEYTKHYNLKKPTQSENYNVEDANLNNEIIDNVLYEKADKEPGKGMSTNDFTDNYKKKIDTMQTLYKPMGTVDTVQALQSITTKKVGDLYRCKQDENNYVWNGQEWVNIGQDADYSELTQQIEQVKQSQQELVDDMSKTYTGTNITAPTVKGVGRVNKVRGFCKQETREGRNLFNINDKSDFNTNVSTDEDDWIHVSYDNSSGTTYAYINTRTKKSNELTINTDYYLVLEIKEISGTGGIAITDNSANQGQFNTAPQLDFSKLSKGTYKYLIHTTDNFDLANSMTRTFVFFGAGKSGSITYRISVLKDEPNLDTFKYEPYGASPSPSFPAKVHCLSDDKQLFDINSHIEFKDGYRNKGSGSKVSSELFYGLKIPTEPKKEYITSSDIKYTGISNLCFFDKDMTFISGMAYNTEDRTFTTPENCVYVTLAIDKKFKWFKLQEGNKVTPWSPFGYGTTTNKSENRNILKSYKNTSFTPTDTSWYDLNGKSGLAGKGLASKTDCKFWVDKGKTYTVNIEQMANANPFQLCKDSETIINGRNNAGKITFTADFDGYVIPRVKVVEANISTWAKNVMVCKGTEVPDYVPHEEDTQTIYLKEPLLGIDDVQDELDLSKGEIIRRFAKKVLDGTENWSRFWGDYGSHLFRITNLDIPLLSDKNVVGCMCNQYKAVSWDGSNNSLWKFKSDSSDDGLIAVQYYSTDKSLAIKDKRFTTATELKAYLAEQYANGTPVEIIYELATPIIESIDCTDKIAQYDGQTTIYNVDGAELECTLTNNRAIAQTNENLEKIEKKIMTNILTAELKEDMVVSAGGDVSTVIKLAELTKVGDNLSVTGDGGIKIGKGVKHVLVSANARLSSNTANKRVSIQPSRNLENTSNRFKHLSSNGFMCVVANKYFGNSISNILVDVQENDVIYLQVYTESGATYTLSNSFCNLTVQVVD